LQQAADLPHQVDIRYSEPKRFVRSSPN